MRFRRGDQVRLMADGKLYTFIEYRSDSRFCTIEECCDKPWRITVQANGLTMTNCGPATFSRTTTAIPPEDWNIGEPKEQEQVEEIKESIMDITKRFCR